MSNKINIDELLKQELGSFAPEPPTDVWQQINSQVQATSGSGTSGHQVIEQTINTVGKVTAISSKVIVFSAVAITSLVSYLGYEFIVKKDSQVKQEQNNIATQNSLPQEESEIKSNTQVKNDENNVVLEQDQAVTASSQATYKRPRNVTRTSTQTKRSEERIIHSSKTEVTSPQIENKKVEYTEKQLEQITNNKEKQGALPSQPATNKSKEVATSKEVGEVNVQEPNMPNVFTPNNDGINDEYVIVIEDEIVYDLKIIDANGKPVFESKDKTKTWDGTNISNGKPCEEGIYIMAFRYQTKEMKEPKVARGKILLERK